MNRRTLRLDKWLWHARLVKSRSLAARLCEAGLVEVEAVTVLRPAHPVHEGLKVRISHGGWRRTVQILGLGVRRGPAAEARELFLELEATRSARNDPDWTPLLVAEERIEPELS